MMPISKRNIEQRCNTSRCDENEGRDRETKKRKFGKQSKNTINGTGMGQYLVGDIERLNTRVKTNKRLLVTGGAEGESKAAKMT